VQTEPHTRERLWWYESTEVADLSELLSATLGHRRRSARIAFSRLDKTIALVQPEVVFMDTGEAWLSASVYHHLRANWPNLRIMFLQHGVLETSGFRAWTPIRRARRQVAATWFRLFGFNAIGAGFGNLRFDGAIVFGRRYRLYIQELHQDCTVVEDFGYVSCVGVAARNRVSNGEVERVLFLDQAFAGSVSNSFLMDVCKASHKIGLPLEYRAHPKAESLPSLPDDVIDRSGGPLLDVLLNGGKALVISYASTSLLEASWLGHEILSVRHPSLRKQDYRAFSSPHSLTALRLRDLNELRSAVYPDVIG
jgi:hypothetical protein